MRMTWIAAVLVGACCVPGCGGSDSRALPHAGHGGRVFELPDQKGFFEILVEGGEPGSRGARRKAAAGQKTSLAVWFYKPDGTTPMDPAPSEVSLKIGGSDSSPTLALKPAPKDAGKLTSDPGPYPDNFAGELNATIDGQPVKAPFLLR
jgi:hypothetical protein